MRPAQEIMAQLAGSDLTPEQLALVMELSAAVATEARPIVDVAAEKKRAYDREYRRERRGNRTKSYDTDDKHGPPKEISKPPSSVPTGTGSAEPDLLKNLFDVGISMLIDQGHTEKQARSLIGSWRKGRQVGDVLAIVLEARTKSISNLVEWMPKRLNGNPPGGSVPLWKHLAEQSQRQAGASP
jgi:hypothetical protein